MQNNGCAPGQIFKKNRFRGVCGCFCVCVVCECVCTVTTKADGMKEFRST